MPGSTAISVPLALGPLPPLVDLGTDSSASLEGSRSPEGRGGPKQRAARLRLGER